MVSDHGRHASASTETFEFGKDGKPLFVAGPHDSPERCHQILMTLEESCGINGFHYLIPQAESAEFLPESLQRAREMIALMQESYERVMSDPGNLLRPGALAGRTEPVPVAAGTA